ncbi:MULTISPECIES: TPM domain-containing protein [Flavobacterium]|uniref:TPM domain-containing protein n=1 Tax=Flavobacterium hankyongi TaxID=1176532 RepID=A0ABP8ZV95_9FLAO|nr:TPM domain-containing protein [Flavobacterium sp. N1846]
MKYIQVFTVFLLILLNNCNSFSQEKEFPKQIGYVNDFQNIFNEDEKNDLENIISDYEKKSSNEIVIISIDFDGSQEEFKTYTLNLSNHWAVGKQNKDNGLTISISSKEKLIRINTGTQTQNILTDSICNNILQQTIIPEFKKGSYYNGVKKGIENLIKVWKN